MPLTEALPGRVGESLGDVGTRAVLFAKHYYGLNDDLGPDLGWGLSISAFNIEGSREPVRRSREVHQLIKWLLPSHPWRLPSHLVEDLQQAAERGGSIEGLQAALEQHTQGLALDEEKARLVGRISEEVLRPLMIILAYLTEGEDVPERYLLIRRETLATVASGLAPRLPAELTFLAEVPVRFRHAYAHGGIGNDGVSVVLDLIEPTERVVVTSEEIDAELESLLQKVLVYVPAILVSLKNRFQITGDSFALPARMVAVETELLFALAGLDVKVRTQVGSVYVTCTALPSHPVRLLSLSAGVKHVVPQATTLIVDCGSEPTFEVELDSLPNRSPEGVECLLLRYRLLTDWCSPSLIDKNDPGAREAELAAPIMRFLWGLLGELIDEEDHEEALRRIRIAERESRRAADQFEPDRRRTSNLRSAFEAADQLKRDCRRVLPLFSQRPWADIKAHGFLTRPERLTALVESFAHQGIEPTLFAGELV